MEKHHTSRPGARADMSKDTVHTAYTSDPWKQMRENKAGMIVNAGHHPPMTLYNGFIFLHGKDLGEDSLEP